MIKASFISRALVSRYADTVELDAAMTAAKGQRRRQLGECVNGAIERFVKVHNVDSSEGTCADLEALVMHEIEKRKVERSRIAKARQKMRDEATKEALEDALYA